MIDKLIRAALFLFGMLCFTGCSFIQSPSLPEKMAGTTTINNFDFDGKPTQIQVQGIPERVIVARPEILDALLALRAENYICAAYITRGKVEQIPELQKKMPKAYILAVNGCRSALCYKRENKIRVVGIAHEPFWRSFCYFVKINKACCFTH